MSNPTDTNQASEDDDIVLRRILFKWAEKFNGMGEPNEGQDGWFITYDKYMDSFTKEVRSIIRTEKLKLLAEVRERVVGEDEPHYDSDRITQNAQRQRNLLRAEQMSNLTKLEAELRYSLRSLANLKGSNSITIIGDTEDWSGGR